MTVGTALGLADSGIAPIGTSLQYHLVNLVAEILQRTHVARAANGIFYNTKSLAKYLNSFCCHRSLFLNTFCRHVCRGGVRYILFSTLCAY